MKKTDARIQMVTESMSIASPFFYRWVKPSSPLAMNVLRMVKFFGWESMMNDRIKDAREAELTYIRKIRLLELSNMMAKWVLYST